jgi:hypothetical protein
VAHLFKEVGSVIQITRDIARRACVQFPRQTKADMDEPDTCLIAAHGYCSQDLVNLTLTGHAVTNCFNGKKDVAGKMCQGVQQRSRLGFLSLFEWFGYTQVGR